MTITLLAFFFSDTEHTLLMLRSRIELVSIKGRKLQRISGRIMEVTAHLFGHLKMQLMRSKLWRADCIVICLSGF